MRKNSKIFGLVACSAVLAGAVAIGASNFSVASAAAEEGTATTVTFQMRKSAQVKYGESAAIRFSATVSESYLEGLAADTVVLKSSIDKMGGSSQQETAEWVVKGNGSTYVSGYQTNTYYHSISFTDAEIESQIKKAAAVDLTATMWLEDGAGNALTQKQTVTRSMRAVANAIYDGVDSDKQTELNKYLGTRTSAKETAYAEISFADSSTTVNKLILPDGVSYDTAYAGANVIADGEIATMYKPTATGTLALFDDETNNVCNYSFLFASSVIESKEEMTDFIANVGNTGYGTGSDYYAILTTDIDYEGATLTTTTNSFYGTFDGYGHTISNFTVGGTGRGLFGNALAVDSVSKIPAKVCNLALVNATASTGSYGAVITGNCYGTIENVFISGTCTNTSYQGLPCNALGLDAKTGVYGKISNCVFVDTTGIGSTSKRQVAVLGGVAVANIEGVTIENTLVISDGIAVTAQAKIEGLDGTYPDITSKYETLTQLSLTNDADKDALKAQAKALAAHGNGWAYDETTTILTYNEQYILRIEIPEPVSETLAAQFVEVGDDTVSLSFNKGTATEVLVEGAPVAATQANGNITFAYATKGRASAVISTAEGTYTIPFVLADYVIDDITSLNAMHSKMTINSAGASQYFVLAENINYQNAQFTSGEPTNWHGTFDGYGHCISNMAIKGNSFLCTTLYGKVMDFAMVNVTATDSGSGGVLCGVVGHATNTYKSTIENVFISGTNTNPTQAGLVAYRILAKSTITNCIVIDNGNLNGTSSTKSLSAIAGIQTSVIPNALNVFTNTIAITDGIALIDNTTKKDDITSQFAGVKQYSHANTAAALASMNGVGDFTYNATTGELSLMGNVVFTLSLNNN